MTGYFNPPYAPQSNPDIEPQWFEPSRFEIADIERGVNTTVTTLPAFGVNNNYVLGQLVRFNIPFFYGIRQLDQQQGYVVGLPATNQFIVNINTSQGYDPFIPNPGFGPTPASVVAVGDINMGTINASGRVNLGTTIPGSFRNISPSAGG